MAFRLTALLAFLFSSGLGLAKDENGSLVCLTSFKYVHELNKGEYHELLDAYLATPQRFLEPKKMLHSIANAFGSRRDDAARLRLFQALASDSPVRRLLAPLHPGTLEAEMLALIRLLGTGRPFLQEARALLATHPNEAFRLKAMAIIDELLPAPAALELKTLPPEFVSDLPSVNVWRRDRILDHLGRVLGLEVPGSKRGFSRRVSYLLADHPELTQRQRQSLFVNALHARVISEQTDLFGRVSKTAADGTLIYCNKPSCDFFWAFTPDPRSNLDPPSKFYTGRGKPNMDPNTWRSMELYESEAGQ